MKGGPINLCAVTVAVSPEAYRSKKVVTEFQCVKNGLLVSACKYYKPMIAAGGLICNNECAYFRYGCTHRAAKKAALKRAYGIIAKRMEDPTGGKTG